MACGARFRFELRSGNSVGRGFTDLAKGPFRHAMSRGGHSVLSGEGTCKTKKKRHKSIWKRRN